jgi:hypothetical protein
MTINFPTVSKTTLNGAIALFIAAVPMAQAYPGLHISPTIMAWLSFAAGVARFGVGIAQKDADTVLATLPGQPVPTVVPAHAVPDNPAAKPVIPQS